MNSNIMKVVCYAYHCDEMSISWAMTSKISIGTNLRWEQLIDINGCEQRRTTYRHIHDQDQTGYHHILHSLSRFQLHWLPAHQQTSQMFKRHLSQAFCEDIAKLVLGVNLNQLYFLGLVCHVLPEPMVLYCIMLGTRSESSWFHLAQGQSSNVVLMNAYVYVGYESCFGMSSSNMWIKCI